MRSSLHTIVILPLLLLAVFIQTSTARDTGLISGTIRDFENGDPISGAVVRLVELNRSAKTDTNGRFTFTNVPVGNYTLEVSRNLFIAVSGVPVEVTAGRTTELSFDLKPAQGRAKDESPVPAEVGKGTRQMKKAAPGAASSEQAPDVVRKSAPAEAQSEGESYDQADRSRETQSYAPKLHIAPLPETRERNYTAPRGDYYYEEEYYDQMPDDMFFREYGTHGWVSTSRDRLSTFAADVDDASYAIAREYLRDGHLPPTEAVRLEEFVNHFDYGYRAPDNGTFRIFTESSPSPFDSRITYLKVGIKGKELARRERRPINLTLVLDISGSMNYGSRFELVKNSIDLLVGSLNSRDHVGIVAYGSHARVVLDPVPANRRDLISRKINQLNPTGSTFAEAGLKLGYEMANEQFEDGYQNIVILCSDGVANVGKTSPDAIMRDIRSFVRRGITLSTFGFGMGNYNDVLLEQLAVEGNGRYAYINDIDQAGKEFADKVTGNTQLLARDLKIQVEFMPQVVEAYRLIGYENRNVADNRFRDNRQGGGEIGSGHEVTALYELRLKPRKGAQSLGELKVRWTDPDKEFVQETGQPVLLSSRAARFDRSRPEFRLAVIASQFGELLKETRFSYELTYDDLLPYAEDIASEMRDEQTRELVDLIEQARSLAGESMYHSDYNYDRP